MWGALSIVGFVVGVLFANPPPVIRHWLRRRAERKRLAAIVTPEQLVDAFRTEAPRCDHCGQALPEPLMDRMIRETRDLRRLQDTGWWKAHAVRTEHFASRPRDTKRPDPPPPTSVPSSGRKHDE